MTRYFVARRGPSSLYVENDFYAPSPGPLPSLFTSEHVATNTGLLASDGEPIMRAPNPMGFGKDGDW